MRVTASSVAVLCFIPAMLYASAPQTAAQVYKVGAGITPPVLVKEVKPQYTAAAMEAKIQGTVPLECVVGVAGTVGDVRVVRSLDADLDQEAIKAVKQWRFKPGTKDGKPVPVRITLDLTFTLR